MLHRGDAEVGLEIGDVPSLEILGQCQEARRYIQMSSALESVMAARVSTTTAAVEAAAAVTAVVSTTAGTIVVRVVGMGMVG